MLQTLQCNRFDCRHNRDGVCITPIVRQDDKPIPIWNEVYNKCLTYEKIKEERLH